MTDLLIRNVPDDVVRTLRRAAAAERKTLRRYVRDLLEDKAGFIVLAEEYEWGREEPFDRHTGPPVPLAPAPELDNVIVLTPRGRSPAEPR